MNRLLCGDHIKNTLACQLISFRLAPHEAQGSSLDIFPRPCYVPNHKILKGVEI
jgi:hypothetical protein